MQISRPLLIAISLALALPAFAEQTTISISPTSTIRQAGGSYVVGDLFLSPGQWRIQEAPSGPSSCCMGYRLVSDTNVQPVSVTLIDNQLQLSSFQAVLQFNDSESEINNIWGWVNAYQGNTRISSSSFGGHYWSQAYERQSVEALLPEFADRIDIIPRVNLGYVGFAYSVSAVPEPSVVAMFSCGLALIGFRRRNRSTRNNSAPV